MMSAQRDAGDAKPALKAGRSDKASRHQPLFVFTDSLESGDLTAICRTRRHGTRDFGVIVNQNQTGAALPVRLAAILRRPNAAAITQRFQQALA